MILCNDIRVGDIHNTAFPGIVYTWDVVNEAIEPDQGGPGLYRTRSPWFAVTGQDFLPAAFRAARKGAAPGQTLCYNDYNAFDPVKRDAIISLLKTLQAENLVDTMGMQGHYVLNSLNIPEKPDDEDVSESAAD